MLFFRTVGIESNPNHRISGEHYRKQQIKNSDLRKNRKTIFSRKSTGAIIFVRRLNAVMSMRVAHLAPLLWLTPATDFCFYFQIYGIRLFNGAIRFVLKHVFFFYWRSVWHDLWLKQSSFDNYNRSHVHSLRHIYVRSDGVWRLFFGRQLWDGIRKNELECARRPHVISISLVVQRISESYSDICNNKKPILGVEPKFIYFFIKCEQWDFSPQDSFLAHHFFYLPYE